MTGGYWSRYHSSECSRIPKEATGARHYKEKKPEVSQTAVCYGEEKGDGGEGRRNERRQTEKRNDVLSLRLVSSVLSGRHTYKETGLCVLHALGMRPSERLEASTRKWA